MQLDKLQRVQVIHASQLAVLVDVPCEVQRLLDKDRVEDIVQYQRRKWRDTGSFIFMGEIIVAVPCDMDLTHATIIDGQHRVAALRQIWKLQPEYKLLMRVVSVGPEFTLADAFSLINKSVPIPDYVMDTLHDSARRRLLDQFVSMFCKQFKAFVSKSRHPRRPNVNMDALMSHVSRSHLVDKFHDASELMQYVLWVNVQVASMDPHVRDVAAKKGENKTVAPLYLSCDAEHEWAYDGKLLMQYTGLMSDQTPNVVTQVSKPKRLSAAVRNACWTQTFGAALEGKCMCCKVVDVTYRNFQAGHIIPRAKGGSDDINNLRPICITCNASMGDEYFDVFADRHFSGDE